MSRTRALHFQADLRPAAVRAYAAPLLGILLFLLILVSPQGIQGKNSRESNVSLESVDSALNHAVPLDGKVVYIDFWASWCPPCRHSFPFMKELASRYGSQGFEVITVSLDKDHAAAEKFLNEMEGDLEVLYDSTGALATAFQVEAMPTSFLYHRDGSFHSRHQGFRAEDTTAIDSLIQELLSEDTKK